MKKLLSMILVGSTLLGCSSTNNTDYLSKYKKLKAEHPVYASLEKDSNGEYYFSKYSLSKMPNSVNLVNLSHNFPTQESECRAGVGDDGDILCQEGAHFTDTTLDGGDLLKNTIGNVIVASATMGLGTSAYYTVKFDHEEFYESLEKAMTKIDRENVINEANQLIAKYETRLNKAQTKFKDLHKDLNSKLKAAVKIKDNSNFYSSKPNVKVRLVSNVKTYLDKSGSWSDIKELATQLDENANNAIQSAKLSLRCDAIRSFNHKFSGCDQVWNFDSTPSVKPITYNVYSVRNYVFYPKIVGADENLTITSDDSGRIKVSNNTGSFITVSSLSFYLGSDIETISNLNIELPPGSVDSSLNMSRFNLYSNRNRSLRNITKDYLNKSVTLGLATKYKIIDANKEKTIYKKTNVKYSEMRGKFS